MVPCIQTCRSQTIGNDQCTGEQLQVKKKCTKFFPGSRQLMHARTCRKAYTGYAYQK